MGAPMRSEADALAFFEALAEAPFRHDFYQTLRRLECLYPDLPRWGVALRPADECIRLGQDADLSFAPAALASFDHDRDGRPPRLHVRFFGLLGPNGPLPLHVTDYARERQRLAGDATISRFLDLFHHRFLAFFYRAWAQAQPHVHQDRPAEDRFAGYVGALFGIEPGQFRQRDSVPDLAKFFHAGVLVRQVRNADGLAAILGQFFGVPVEVESFVGHWLTLGARDRTYLGRQGVALGVDTVVGGRVWDRQHKFRLRLGPLTLAQYESFLPAPSGAGLAALVDWVRLYLSMELDWDAQLVLRRDDVPPLTLGAGRRLGWTTWLGGKRRAGDAADLCLNAEALLSRIGARAA